MKPAARHRVLVTGRSGQVALALAALDCPDLEIMTLGRPQLDIADASLVAKAFLALRPDIVVNTAAYTDVDRAESEPEQAFAVNHDGAANVASAAASLTCPIVHFSTDYVFSGDKAAPYREDDATGPLGVYGLSKLAGEKAISQANPAHAILRTAWVYSPSGRNFVTTMLRLAGEHETVRVVCDQRGTPTSAAFLAGAVAAIVRHILARPQGAGWRGIFHVVPGGATDWAGFAEEIFCQSAMRGGATASVERITSAEYRTRAVRPANSCLDTARFRVVFGVEQPPWQQDVAACVAYLLGKNNSSTSVGTLAPGNCGKTTR